MFNSTDLKIVRLDENAVSGQQVAVLDLADVADDDLADADLLDLGLPDDREFVLALDAVLQPAELPLLRVVIERGNEYNYDNRYQYGQPLDPAVRRFVIVERLRCRKHHKTIKYNLKKRQKFKKKLPSSSLAG